MAGRKFLSLVIVALQTARVFTQACSEIDLIDECQCSTVDSGVKITCKKLTNTDQIQTALMASKDCVDLRIEDSTVPSLPLDLGPHSLQILGIKNTKMPYISPPTSSRSALDGLGKLQKLNLENIPDLSNWDWRKLKDLPSLTVLYINEGALVHITKEFSEIAGSKMEELILGNCKLGSISEGGLAFPNLKLLQITDDPLENLEATMFHSDSKIETMLLYALPNIRLPTDVFSNMKHLMNLHIDSPMLDVLTREHLAHTKLQDLVVYPGDHPITCSCKHSWVLEHRSQYLGVCNDENKVQQDLHSFLNAC